MSVSQDFPGWVGDLLGLSKIVAEELIKSGCLISGCGLLVNIKSAKLKKHVLPV